MRLVPLLFFLVACLGFASSPVARAQAVVKPTLEKIREYRAVYVGYREYGLPFSYLVGDEPMGYSLEICDHVVEAIKVAISDPAIRVVRVPVSSTLRFLMLQGGVIDLECGSTTNTRIRQHLVSFGVTIYVSGVRAAVRSDAPIKEINELDGKAVVTLGGTSTERVVSTSLGAKKLAAVMMTTRTYAQAMELVLNGQADAFVTDDALMAGVIASSPNPEKFKLLEGNFGFEPYGIGIRRDDPDFKKIVDDTIRGLMKSGELARIYDRWFMSPIPPKGINLNMPMSGLLKEMIRNPNDEGN